MGAGSDRTETARLSSMENDFVVPRQQIQTAEKNEQLSTHNAPLMNSKFRRRPFPDGVQHNLDPTRPWPLLR